MSPGKHECLLICKAIWSIIWIHSYHNVQEVENVKELFPGYYPLTDHDRNTLWKKGIFILDTNVLLSLYRYPEAARDDLIGILKKLSNQNRIWIPFQVALEYQRLRSDVIDMECNKYCRVKSDLEKAKKNIKNCLNQTDLKEQCYSADREDLMKEVDDFFDKLCTKMESLALKRLGVSQGDELDKSYDQLTDQIDQITKGKIGPPPDSQQWLDEIYKEGERRYELKIPPGYGNSDKTDGYSYGGLVFYAKYGDLVLWHQIIEYIKEQEDLQCVVFITDEKGDDWWRKEGGDITCPRPELVTELLSKTGISLFHMYRPDRFMELAKVHLKAKVRKKAIAQVRDMSVMAASADMSWLTGLPSKPDMSWLTELISKPDMSWLTELTSKPDMSWLTELPSKPDMSWLTELISKPDMSWLTGLTRQTAQNQRAIADARNALAALNQRAIAAGIVPKPGHNELPDSIDSEIEDDAIEESEIDSDTKEDN